MSRGESVKLRVHLRNLETILRVQRKFIEAALKLVRAALRASRGADWRKEAKAKGEVSMKKMKMLVFVLWFSAVALGAGRDHIIAEAVTTGESPKLVVEGDRVFSRIASGGGWETVMVFANLSTRAVNYRLAFFDDRGGAMTVTFRTYPDGQLTQGSGITGTLGANQGDNFSLFDIGEFQVGWALLTYDDVTQRMGGYALLRQRVPGRPDFETLVPLGNLADTKFYMPFDNIQGYTTALALTNPGANLTNGVSLTFLNLNGQIILQDTIALPPGAHIAFAVTDRYPQLSNRLGTLYVQGSTSRLAGMGLRFHSSGAFSSIPIMNWLGMLP